MSHQDFEFVVERCNADCLRRALRWLLSGVCWSSIRFRNDCTWTPASLASAALLWAWADETTLVERFDSVRSIVRLLFPKQPEPAETYQAFVKMLRRWTDAFVPLLRGALRRRIRGTLADWWEVGGFVMFGVDGTRVELPRTRSHERIYSATRPRARRKSSKGRHFKKANSPQMWLTTMWHAGTGLPWDWRSGPSDSSERGHLLEMLPELPPGALVAADAGFVGYEYLRSVVDGQRHVLIRVGANVRLLRKLGYARESAGTVYLWPDREAKRHEPPLVLRLVTARNGRHPVCLVTSLLSPSRCRDGRILELYARRWGVELFYRHLKQTFERRKLRSLSAAGAHVELQWSLLGLAAMSAYALAQLRGRGIPPSRLSCAQMLRAFRRTMRDHRHPSRRGSRLRDRLRTALIDSYERGNKSSRDYPRKKRESPPGRPVIRTASRCQKRLARTLRDAAT
jgi:hypothetical protein